jgi:methylglutaconyl-CoA hydratase
MQINRDNKREISRMNADILYSVAENGLATVTMNRPNTHNAFNNEVIQLLQDAFARAVNDKPVRALLLQAKGSSFCAGGDMNWMKQMAGYSYEENLADSKKIAAMLNKLNTLPMPTIARVQGAAYGGGVGLVACCDIAVATTNANFCLSEVKVGMIPATISPYVIAAIGQRASRRYFTTAEVISAEKALGLGLISECCATEEDADHAIAALIKALLKNGPRAVSEAKKLVLDLSNRPIDAELIEESSRRIALTRDSSEGKEGLSAFLEKRKPNWIQ